MNIRYWLSLTSIISASALAQPAAPSAAPSINAPATVPALALPDATLLAAPDTGAPAKTNAPAAKPKKKKAAAKKVVKKAAAKKPDAASTIRSEPLVPGPATVIASNVNVRGQAKLHSEVVTRLTKGDSVTVLQEVTLKNSKSDEPSAWAKIIFPSKAHVWVNSAFIDATNKTVIPKKLNVRTGPGENYSVAGLLLHGDAIKDLQAKENWMEIEAPTNAFAFVAAAYLKSEVPTPAPEPAPTPTDITQTNVVAAPASEAPANLATNEPTPPIAPAPAPVVSNEPPPKRIVEREGIVRGTFSIQAPTHYALISAETGKTINYLYTSSPYLDLSRYKGLHIIVTGEEGLDERWPHTPVITIQKIQVLE